MPFSKARAVGGTCCLCPSAHAKSEQSEEAGKILWEDSELSASRSPFVGGGSRLDVCGR